MPRTRPGHASGSSDPVDGILLVDKPAGWTSHDVVARARRFAGTKKVGHAGTLDPMATGLLVLGVNRATRLLTYLVGADKEYVATIRLGQSTVTDDAEGDVVSAAGATDVTTESLERALAPLRGAIAQVPSSVSAIKVDGKRSYARVRGGEDVQLPPRPVTVHRFDVLDVRAATSEDGVAVVDVDAVVVCSSGTYVRALARDLGAALGTGGHLTALRRTRVGPFTVSAAADLDTLGQAHGRGEPVALVGASEAARAVLPVRDLTADEARELRYGRAIATVGVADGDPASGMSDGTPAVAADDGAAAVAGGDGDATGGAARGAPVEGASDAVVAAVAPDGTVVALVTDRGGRTRPVLVLDPA